MCAAPAQAHAARMSTPELGPAREEVPVRAIVSSEPGTEPDESRKGGQAAEEQQRQEDRDRQETSQQLTAGQNIYFETQAACCAWLNQSTAKPWSIDALFRLSINALLVRRGVLPACLTPELRGAPPTRDHLAAIGLAADRLGGTAVHIIYRADDVRVREIRNKIRADDPATLYAALGHFEPEVGKRGESTASIAWEVGMGDMGTVVLWEEKIAAVGGTTLDSILSKLGSIRYVLRALHAPVNVRIS